MEESQNTQNRPFVITVARSFGSGGKYIGMELSKKLNIPCYDDDIKKMLEEQHGIHNKHFQNMEEKMDLPNWIQKLRKKPVSEYVVSPHEEKFISNVGLYKMQCALLDELANAESYVIMGKCANHVLRQKNNVMSIHVSAPMSYCVGSICKKTGSTPEEAKKLITKTDKYRKDYYKFYTEGGRWDNPEEYDFMMNTARLGRDTCVDMILAHIHRRFGVDVPKEVPHEKETF